MLVGNLLDSVETRTLALPEDMHLVLIAHIVLISMPRALSNASPICINLHFHRLVVCVSLHPKEPLKDPSLAAGGSVRSRSF